MNFSDKELIDLRWALYHFTANKPGFFADEQIMRVRKLICKIDKEMDLANIINKLRTLNKFMKMILDID